MYSTPYSTKLPPFLELWGLQIPLYINNVLILFISTNYLPLWSCVPPCISAEPLWVTTMPLLTSSLFHMVPLFSLLLFSLMIRYSTSQDPPSPGYYPSSKISPVSFGEGFRNLWGPQHQKLDQDSLTIWLDSYSGMKNVSHKLPTSIVKSNYTVKGSSSVIDWVMVHKLLQTSDIIFYSHK